MALCNTFNNYSIFHGKQLIGPLRLHLFLSLLFLFYSALIHGQTKFIEKVEKKGNSLVIPYEKYVLKNGLTLLIHEDHSDPLVHVDVTYHVGSAREVTGRSGFAHFFEHMMFQGSDHVADEQHFKIISEAGGTMNGTTSNDRTNYFETIPRNQLEIALWLEADRMGFLLDAVTTKKFEVQRSTVINERGQRIDNRPYGRANEKINAALYPTGHPYSWPTIGWIEDLNKANVDDLKKFFLRWYGPNNAVLTIAGDVNTQETIKLVEKYFNSINSGPMVTSAPKVPVTLEKNTYISFEDNVRLPMLQLTFPTVHNYHPDEAPLDVLSYILGGTPSSIFYKNFVKNQLATEATVQHPAYELSGQFNIEILVRPGKTLTEIEGLIRKSLEEFEKRGVTKNDLLSFKATYEARLIGSLTSVKGKAGQLASYQTFTGNPNYINDDLSRYDKIKKEDVMRVFEKYIKNKPAIVLSVYPKGKPELVAHPDNFNQNKNEVAFEKKAYDTLVYKKPIDTFDRSKKPEPGEAPSIKIPEYWQEISSNQLKIIGLNNTEIPMVTLQLSIEAGHWREGANTGKAGIAELLAALLNESTKKTTAEKIAKKLDRFGSSIEVTTDKNYIVITVNSLTKYLDQTLHLLQEKLFQPKFDVLEFDRIKNQQLEKIANQQIQPTFIANNAFNSILYGKNSISGIPLSGTEETVKSISLQDVRDYYKRNISPSISNLVIVGDIDQKSILHKTKFLNKSWKIKETDYIPEAITLNHDTLKIYLIDKEGAPQSEIRIGYVAIPYDAYDEFYKANVMNFILGGSFNSRLNLNLREDKGYTYGVKSSFSGDKRSGVFLASAGVRANVTDLSLIEFMNELKKYRTKGITNEELNFTKMSIGQSEALKYETPVQKASFLKRIIIYNLDRSFVEEQNKVLKNITKEEVSAFAKQYLPLDKMSIVVVGDKKSILPGLLRLGVPIVEVDKTGTKKEVSH
jgi:zinc protease